MLLEVINHSVIVEFLSDSDSILWRLHLAQNAKHFILLTFMAFRVVIESAHDLVHVEAFRVATEACHEGAKSLCAADVELAGAWLASDLVALSVDRPTAT